MPVAVPPPPSLAVPQWGLNMGCVQHLSKDAMGPGASKGDGAFDTVGAVKYNYYHSSLGPVALHLLHQW